MSFLKSLKLYFSKITALLVKYRMRSKRVIIALVVLLILFTKPAIEPGTVYEIIFDWLGYFLIILACLGRIFSSVFICGRKNEKLSTQGFFSIVRNPLYVFSFFGTMGIGLLSGYITIFALFLVIFCLYYPAVVKDEEVFLAKKFGKEYKAYQQDVPRWFPRQWKLNLPETTVVYPRLLLQTILDASLFFLVFPIVESIELLHKTGLIPTFFSLY